MTRSIIIAILAFGLLILVNLAIFGYLATRTLSERMVTEQLIEGLNEARRLVGPEGLIRDLDSRAVTEEIAPRLQRFTFIRAILVVDSRGRLIHREFMRATGVIRVPERRVIEPAANLDTNWRMIPVQNTDSKSPQLVLEYDEKAIRSEVDALRADLDRKMWYAIGLSLVLLVIGLAYVISAYRRNQVLQQRALKADRLAYVGTLSSGLAHEIRNPLNSMNMNVQLIEEEMEDMGIDETTEIREMLVGTRKEVRRLEQMVSSFLAFARPTRLETKPTAVNELVGETLMLLETEFQQHQVQIKTAFSEDLPKIPLDPSQMKQALINVIQNGVQILNEGQTIEISTRRAGGDNILITIRDEGPGISPEELKNIFREFYSTRVGGTGLGLPIAQRIAELHQGGIKVESEIGKGTTFTFILPISVTET